MLRKDNRFSVFTAFTCFMYIKYENRFSEFTAFTYFTEKKSTL